MNKTKHSARRVSWPVREGTMGATMRTLGECKGHLHHPRDKSNIRRFLARSDSNSRPSDSKSGAPAIHCHSFHSKKYLLCNGFAAVVMLRNEAKVSWHCAGVCYPGV